MDGTITIDNTAIGGAVEFCEAVKNKGASVAYFTNNASKSPSDYVQKLKRIGIEARKDIEAFFRKHVYLELYVKVEKDWRNKENKLRKNGTKILSENL